MPPCFSSEARWPGIRPAAGLPNFGRPYHSGGRVVCREVPMRAQVRMARCRLGERGGTCFTAIFERPDLRDELCDPGRAECGFGVRSARSALAGRRVGEAANAARPQHSAADVVCVDWRPVVADAIGLDSLERCPGVIAPSRTTRGVVSQLAGTATRARGSKPISAETDQTNELSEHPLNRHSYWP